MNSSYYMIYVSEHHSYTLAGNNGIFGRPQDFHISQIGKRQNKTEN